MGNWQSLSQPKLVLTLTQTSSTLRKLNNFTEEMLLYRRKLLVLKMRHSGVPLEMIANSLKITVRSVSNYIAEFRDGGLEVTLEDRAYCPMSSVDPHLDELEESFRNSPVGSARQARRRIIDVTGIELSLTQTRHVMKRLGMRYRKAGQVPGKANGDEQLEFLNDKLEPRLAEAREGKRKVFFVDAAHFVMGAVVGMLWCFQRVFVRGASGRKRYNVLGAVDSQTKKITTVTNDTYITAPTVCQLLLKLHRANPNIPITIVLDNARYQKCKLVSAKAEELGIELLYLPPYSPNLNIIERLWKFIKQECLKNTYYESFGEFTTAIDQKIKDANTTLRSKMKSLLSLKFQILPSSPETIL
jgi:transposase